MFYEEKQYKGLYYKYVPEKDQWHFSDIIDGSFNLFSFNASHYRLDQCFWYIFRMVEKGEVKLLRK